MSICQLQNMIKSILMAIFVAIFLSGCALFKSEIKEKPPEEMIIPHWQKLPLRFAHRDMNDDFITHPFFDVDPMVSFDNNIFTLRYFVSTPAKSLFQYDFDLYSGELYRQRQFCPQKDIWEFYGGEVFRPNFSQGFAPRVFNENGKPMKVILLSSSELLPNYKLKPISYDDAKILGSVIIEQCETFPCQQKSKWKSSQVLVGLSRKDPISNDIKTFSELKDSVDWNYDRAVLTNMNGHYLIGSKTFPAYRISKELNLKDTWEYFGKTAKVYHNEKMTEMVKWRDECMKMYDSLWNDSEKIRALPNGQGEEFLKLFKSFHANDGEKFYTCQALVRPGNIVENSRRLWFFAYIQAFFLLEKNGFYFNCQDKSWAYNPKIDDERLMNNQITELERCRAKDLDAAFDQAINGMSLMRNNSNHQLRFVEYDNMRGGSHQKIYAWIKTETLNYSCTDSSAKQSPPVFDIFPQDVVWENFKQDDEKLVK